MRERTVGHRDVEVAAAAGARSVEQCSEDAHGGGERTPHQVGDRQVRQRERVPVDADLVSHAGVPAVVEVVPRPVAVGATLAVAGQAAVDDARIDSRHFVVAQTQSRHRAGAKTFDDHVGIVREAQEGPGAFGLLQVDLQAALVAVDDGAQRGRCMVARACVLDLHDIGAEVGQVLRAYRTGHQAREVQHAHAAQRRFADGHVDTVGVNTGTAPPPSAWAYDTCTR